MLSGYRIESQSSKRPSGSGSPFKEEFSQLPGQYATEPLMATHVVFQVLGHESNLGHVLNCPGHSFIAHWRPIKLFSQLFIVF